ncbi:MAG: hypothetical protein KDA98_00025 [Acidimicrobiales bacterium]|nr:hypothetical protein [Acidimicrobiales bacterium]
MRALRPAQAAPDRRGLPWWIVAGLALAAGLALGIAGRAAAQGELTPTVGGLSGFAVGVLAVVGLPSFSIRLVARMILLVSAAVLVRFGVFGDALDGGGQALVLWVAAAVAVLVLADRVDGSAGRALTGPGAPSDTPAVGPTARSVAAVVVAVVLLAVVATPLLLPYAGQPTAAGDGPTLDPQADGAAPLRASDALDMTTRPDLTDEVVLTIEAARPTFWRGQTFDTWDGRTWTRSDPGFSPLAGPGTVQIGAEDLGALGDVELTQRVTVETAYAEVIYAAPSPVEVDVGRPLRQRDDGTLVTSPLGQGATYTVVSRSVPLTPARLRAVDGEVPATVAARYAQPPATTDRVRDLADEIAADAPTAYDAIVAFEEWMDGQVEYSLEAPLAPRDVDVVDHFLFEAEEGWCEQIASSLVVLARTQGIPARLVTGYVPGDRDPVTGAWTVRERDAHAWAEVWFPEVGWVPFDPTADVPLAGEDGGPQTIAEWLADHLVLLALGAIAVALAAGPLRAAVRRRLAARADRPQGWAAETDARLAALGDRVDRPRRLDETAGAYATALAERWADPRLAAVGHALDDALYAPAPPDAARRAACDEVLDELADAEAPAPDPVGAPSA